MSFQNCSVMLKCPEKIIFLDVDGVLQTPEDTYDFNPSKMRMLGEIVARTDAAIVISSDWRRNPSSLARLRSELLHYGLQIFDITHFAERRVRRKEEIKRWLRENEGWAKVAIIDDSPEAHLYKPGSISFFEIDKKLGLTDSNSSEIIAFLGEKTCLSS